MLLDKIYRNRLSYRIFKISGIEKYALKEDIVSYNIKLFGYQLVKSVSMKSLKRKRINPLVFSDYVYQTLLDKVDIQFNIFSQRNLEQHEILVKNFEEFRDIKNYISNENYSIVTRVLKKHRDEKEGPFLSLDKLVDILKEYTLFDVSSFIDTDITRMFVKSKESNKITNIFIKDYEIYVARHGDILFENQLTIEDFRAINTTIHGNGLKEIPISNYGIRFIKFRHDMERSVQNFFKRNEIC